MTRLRKDVMRSPFKREPSDLQKQINTLLDCMDQVEPESAEYNTYVKRLSKLKKIERENRPSRLSRDTMAIAGCNLAGILIIVLHERVGVIGSKALGQLMKPKH